MSHKVSKKVQEIEVIYKPLKCNIIPVKISNSEDAYCVFKSNWSKQIALQEEFNMLLLDRANQVLGIVNLSKGGINATVVDVRIAFATALKSRASSIILGHNHPSGSINPSEQDIVLTKKFKEAGKLIEITVLDHIILCAEESYYSFADDLQIL